MPEVVLPFPDGDEHEMGEVILDKGPAFV